MRISDWSSDVCSSDLLGFVDDPRKGSSYQRWPRESAFVPIVGGGPEFSTSAELTTTHRNSPDPGPRNFRWLNLGSIDRKRDEKRGEISAVRFLSPRQGDEAIPDIRSEEHTSELQSLMRTSYAVFFLTTNTP